MLQIFNNRFALHSCCWFALTIVFAPAVFASQAAPDGDYNSEWGPVIGSSLPVLEAPDQAGQVRSLDDLSGEQGLLLFLNRSADW